MLPLEIFILADVTDPTPKSASLSHGFFKSVFFKQTNVTKLLFNSFAPGLNKWSIGLNRVHLSEICWWIARSLQPIKTGSSGSPKFPSLFLSKIFHLFNKAFQELFFWMQKNYTSKYSTRISIILRLLA